MSVIGAFSHLDNYGIIRTFQRLDPPGPATSVSVKCMQRNAMEVPMIGEVSQEDTVFYVRKQTLVSAGFPTPPVKGDRISHENQVFVVKSVNEQHATGVVGGYRLICRGH